MTTLGPFEGKTPARPDPGGQEPARVPVGAGRTADDSRRLAQRRLPRPAHDAGRPRRSSPTGRATSSSSSATTAPPTSSFSAPTTPGRPTTAGRASIRSTPIPRGTQGPWADVSFDRPYGREAQYDAVVNDPLTFGSGEFLPFEFPLAYWLEQHGYDVTYCSNSDMLSARSRPEVQGVPQRRPRRILGHPPVPQRPADARRRRQPAVPLGQRVCWVTPLRAEQRRPAEPDHVPGRARTAATTPTPAAAEKEHGPFPEHGPDEGLLMGARTSSRSTAAATGSSLKPDHWIFAGTGMKKGDRIPGLVGWEYHGDPPKIPGLRSRRRRHGLGGRPDAPALDRDDLSRAEGELRVQRLDDLLGPGTVVPAGPHAPLVALVAAPRPGRTRPEDHAEPARAGDPTPTSRRVTHSPTIEHSAGDWPVAGLKRIASCES